MENHDITNRHRGIVDFSNDFQVGRKSAAARFLNLFSFEGRISRSQYWGVVLLVQSPLIILGWAIVYFWHTENGEFSILNIGRDILLFQSWPGLAAAVKRWHDRNHSALWLLSVWLLAFFIPFGPIFSLNFWGIISLIFVLIISLINVWFFIEIGFFKGTQGTNRFGNDPLETTILTQSKFQHEVNNRDKEVSKGFQLSQINRVLAIFLFFFGVVVIASLLFTETFVGKMTNFVAGLVLVLIGAIMILQTKLKREIP